MLILADIPIPKVEVGGNVLILSVIFFALLCRYLIARFRHKQILAAIEKGLPLSDLKANKLQAPRWITNLTFGIALLLISPCIIIFGLALFGEWHPRLLLAGTWTERSVLPPLILFLGITLLCVAIACLIKALLQRRTNKRKTEVPRSPTSK